MADEDLYDDFGMAGDTPRAQAGADSALGNPFGQAQGAGPSAQQHHADQNGSEEAQAELPAFQLDALQNAEELDAEQAVNAIAEAMQLQAALDATVQPGAVAAAVAQVLQELQACKQQLHAEQKKQLAYQIQCANMATDLLDTRQQVVKATAAAQPSVVHLRTLHTDPAAAKEFAMLRDDNMRLQRDNVKLRSEVEALQFKAIDQKGKAMLAKLNAVMEDKQKLEWQLQQQDATLVQLELTRKQLRDAAGAYTQAAAQGVALRAQAEDLAAHVAALHRSDGQHGAFNMRGPGGLDRPGPSPHQHGATHGPPQSPGYGPPPVRQPQPPPRRGMHDLREGPIPRGGRLYARGGRGGGGPGGRWGGQDEGLDPGRYEGEGGGAGFGGKRLGMRGYSERPGGGGRGRWM